MPVTQVPRRPVMVAVTHAAISSGVHGNNLTRTESFARRSGSLVQTSPFANSAREVHAATSVRVRAHPRQKPVASSILQTPTQGECRGRSGSRSCMLVVISCQSAFVVREATLTAVVAELVMLIRRAFVSGL